MRSEVRGGIGREGREEDSSLGEEGMMGNFETRAGCKSQRGKGMVEEVNTN